RRNPVLGGSAAYFSVVASNFTAVNMVAVVGDDFPDEHVDFFKSRSIDIRGLERKPGKTFFWSGKYADDFSTRTTLATHLNVFADFDPVLPESYRSPDFLFLANIHPALQLKVLNMVEGKPFVAGDTMNLWIDAEPVLLKELISRVDLLTINDEEVRLLTGEFNLIKAGRMIQEMGPKYLILKKGEHGALLFLEDSLFFTPAIPLEGFVDPTGAGDSFAGGFMGHLARKGTVDAQTLKEAMFYGAVVASFTVEDYSLERHRTVDYAQIEERFQQLVDFTTL
ncbi:sugar kinase, partial [Myxococcota bacterium]|nr:sugar kinase [Myxococcota bacterium]